MTRLLGFPAGQPYPADASARPLLPWTFFLFQVFGRLACASSALTGRRRGDRARMPDRPLALVLTAAFLSGGRGHPLVGLGTHVACLPFSVLQGRCLVHPEQPSKGKDFPVPRHEAAGIDALRTTPCLRFGTRGEGTDPLSVSLSGFCFAPSRWCAID